MLHIFPLRDEVERHNDQMLSAEQAVVYTATDSGRQPWKSQLSHVGLDAELRVKVGAPVMLLHNIDVDAELVNGAIGSVVECTTDLLRVQFGASVRIMSQIERGIECAVTGACLASRKAYPVRLAYAATIDKVQALTLTSQYAMDLASLERRGGNRGVLRALILVALSRARRSDLVHLRLPQTKGNSLSNSKLAGILNQGRDTYRTQILPALAAMSISATRP
jgi:ATP-dependent DNA helicase PIF1